MAVQYTIQLMKQTKNGNKNLRKLKISRIALVSYEALKLHSNTSYLPYLLLARTLVDFVLEYFLLLH